MPIEKRTFEGGMNTDLAEGLLKLNQYRYALNIRNGNSEKGAVGVITNAEGNRLPGSQTLPSGDNKVIGAYDDDVNNRVIFIVFNDAGNNRIFAYDYSLNEYQTIIQDSGNVLDLNANYLVTSINVVDANDTSYLLFTDNWGEPKNINIDQALRTYDTIQSGSVYKYRKFFGDFDTVSPTNVGAGDVYSRDIFITADNGSPVPITRYYRAKNSTAQNPTSSTTSVVPQSDWEFCPAGYIYGNLSSESFTNIVKPPREEPIINYTSNGNKYNYLYQNLYQFKIKYVKSDGRESSWSPVTLFKNPEYPSDGELDLVAVSSISKLYNNLRVNVPLPDPTIYKTVKVAIRRAMNDKAPSDWQLVGTIDCVNISSNLGYEVGTVADKLTTPFNFDGTQALMPLDTNDATQLMSWIPRRAKAQSITSRNRILYSNFTEGLPYELNGENSITENAPIVKFFERENPFRNVTTAGLDVYEVTSAGTISATSITAAAYPNGDGSLFDPIIAPVALGGSSPSQFATTSGQGLAFKFPASVEVGDSVKVGFAIGYTYHGGSLFGLVDPSIHNPARDGNLGSMKTLTVGFAAESTTVSELIDLFINRINNNQQLRIDNFGNLEWDYQVCEAVSAASGGSEYLIIKPSDRVAEVVQGYTGGGGLTNVNIILEPYFRYYPASIQGIATSPTQSFKRGTSHTFGIVYSDDNGRLSTVIEHPNFTEQNPWWIDEQYFDSQTYNQIGQRYANIYLSHDAPSWATRYHIVKTINNGIRNYVSFPLSLSDTLARIAADGSTNPFINKFFIRGYVKPEFSVAASALSASADSIGSQELLYIPLNALQSSQYGYSNISSTNVAYDFTPGDRIRFCYTIVSASSKPTASGNYFSADADAEIIGYSADVNAIVIRINDLPDSLTGSGEIFEAANENGSVNNNVAGLLCEIYSPITTTENSFYYEMFTDAVYESSGRYLHRANTTDQSSASAATISLYNGDSFLKARTYTWRYVEATPANSKSITYYVEDANHYDKVESKTWGAGRPNRSIRSTSQDEDITGFLGEVKRPTTIRYSEPFSPEQGYNGLGTIHDINFKDANGALRAIQHMYTDGSKTFIFHENDTGYVESDRAVTTTLDGSNITIGANTPISDVMYYGAAAGIGRNPESFAANNYRKYFVDITRGQVCRLSQDGITPISELGMNKYFKKVFREMMESPQTSNAFGAYDRRTDEYTLCMQWNTEVIGTANFPANTSYNTVTKKLTFTIADTSIYNIYVGQFITLSIPRQDNFDGTYTWTSFRDEFVISNLTSTEITLQMPLILKYNDLDNQLGIFFGGVLDPKKPGNATASIFPTITQTITYNENLKAWTSFHSFDAEFLSSAGLEFVSFRGGNLYIHDDYSNPQSYYGVDYPAYIDVISNMGADQVKIWKTAALKATTEDAELDETDFLIAIDTVDTTGTDESIPGGVQDSRGKISTGTTFVLKEGQLYSEYMRTGTGTSYSDFIEGDKVRGYWVYTRFKINSGINKIYKILSASFDFLMSNYTR
jgi:hypothetical protein